MTGDLRPFMVKVRNDRPFAELAPANKYGASPPFQNDVRRCQITITQSPSS